MMSRIPWGSGSFIQYISLASQSLSSSMAYANDTVEKPLGLRTVTSPQTTSIERPCGPDAGLVQET